MSRRRDAKYCSERCAVDSRQHVNNAQRRLRADGFPAGFSRRAIYERDDWVCGLCGEPVDPALTYPDPECASLDHVVPLSRGGSHDPTNLQLAHLRCNYAAGDRKVDQTPRPPLVVDGVDYYRTGEAVEIIGTTRSVLSTAIKRGRVPAVRTAGGRYLLAAEVVADLAVTGVPKRVRTRKERPTERQVTCRWCGEVVTVAVDLSSRRAYCSEACVRESRKVRKRKGRAVVTTPCAVCGTPVEHEVNGPKNRLCSPECVQARRRQRRQQEAAADYEPQPCKVCGEPVPFVPGRRGPTPATCSDECARRWPALRARQHYERNKRNR
jgi:hypothetical protein